MLHVEHDGGASIFGRVGPLFVLIWKTGIEYEDVALFARWTEVASKELPGYAVMSVTRGALKLPDGESRKRIAELTKNPPPNFKGTSTVIESEGFAASAMRMALAGMNLLGGKALSDNVARNVEEGLVHIARLLPIDAAATRAAVDELMRRAHP